ncbi:MAG: (d)CMP kinase [Acidimicrobiales bacterium]
MCPVISIDGPAGSGKSTLARSLGERLSLDVLDTGAMYRVAALLVLRRGIGSTLSTSDASDEQVASLIRGCSIEVGPRVLLDGTDVTDAIRMHEVDMIVSYVAAIPAVREDLVARQRAWITAHNGCVVEGRDIGTVVAPDADLKVFLIASDEARIARRAAERGVPFPGVRSAGLSPVSALESKGETGNRGDVVAVAAAGEGEGPMASGVLPSGNPITDNPAAGLANVAQGILDRDRIDSTRQVGALLDAVKMMAMQRDGNVLVIDSTAETADTVLDVVLSACAEKGIINAI